MKKLAAFFLICLTGCKKQSPTVCYECDMTYASGIPADKQYPCTSNLRRWQNEQKDNSGAPITSDCRRRR